MKRRNFIQAAAITTGELVLSGKSAAGDISKKFSLDQNRVRIYSPQIKTPAKVLMVSDTQANATGAYMEIEFLPES